VPVLPPPPPPREISDWSDLEREWRRVTAATAGHLFEELDRFFRARDDDLPNHTNMERQDLDSSEADTFDELYATIRSAFSEAERPFTTLAKLIRDAAAEAEAADGDANSRQDLRKLDAPPPSRPDGLERRETNEEHVDAFGNVHRKQIVQFVDRDGVEVGREERYSVRTGERSGEWPASEPDGNEGMSTHRPTPPDKPSGWFWK